MVSEPKDVDFYTTGRQPFEQEFVRINEWIKQDKHKKATRKAVKPALLTKASALPSGREAA